MEEFTSTIQLLGMRRDVAAQELMNAIVSAQRLGVLELVDRTQELGCSFEESTRALFQVIVSKMLESCRSKSERDDEVILMNETMRRLIERYEEN